MAIVYFRPNTHTDIQYWRNRLLGVAAAFHGRIKVVMSDEEAFRREVEVLGFGDSGEDVVVGLWSSDRERYAFSGDIEEEELTEFVQVRMPQYSSSPSVRVVYCISPSCIILNTVCLNILFIVCNTIMPLIYCTFSSAS